MVYEIGEWRVDPADGSVTNGQELVRLRPRVMSVLVYMAERPNTIVSTDEMLDALWTDTVTGDYAIYAAISTLRRTFHDDKPNPSYIETLPKRGYRLIAPVSASHASESTLSNRPADATDSAGDSIAVLRFADMSAGRDQGALCEGIAEEILNKLARIRNLKVIARTSSFLYDSTSTPIREIGQRLGVRHVLEGSVRTSGSRVRITAQLIECEGESHSWSKSYTRELVDTFALYDEVASDIGRELNLAIGGDEVPKAASPPTHSFAAFNLLTEARFRYRERAQPRDALPLVEQALELDPDYAEAHSYKGLLLWAQADMGHVPAEQGYIAARRSVERALQTDSELASAHTLMGLIHQSLDLDFRLAAESYREAERLGAGPNPHFLMDIGHYQEALEVYQQMEERDPANPMAKVFVGRALDRLGRVEEAGQKLEEAFELGPRNNFVLLDILRHYIGRARDFDQAARVIEESKGSRQILRWANAVVALEQGDGGEARALVEQWVRGRDSRYVAASAIEGMFYALGDFGEHIRWFAVREKEKDQLSFVPTFLRDTPDYWDKLREWALSSPDVIRDRMEMLDEHRTRIDRITEKMVL